MNSRLDEIQAAVLRIKLKNIDRWNEGRRAAAERYNDLLASVPGVTTPYESGSAKHVFHQYTIRVHGGKRDDVEKALASQGISTMVYYPVPMHKLPVYTSMALQLPLAEQAAREVLSLPIWPSIQVELQERVVAAIKANL